MHRPRIRFAGQILALQIGVLTLVVGVGFALVGWLFDTQQTDQYGQRALAVARSVAADPDIAAGIEGRVPRATVQHRALAVGRATHALFVVVTDVHGIRLAHPNPAEVGRHVSTDPSAALAGREVVNVERGTLGLSARGKVPVYGTGHRVVGEVSVGFAVRVIRASVIRVLGDAALFAAGALLLGAGGAALLARRLKSQTLGLEPHELAELVQEREAVLHGIGEGVLATDADGRISVCNDEASRLIGVPAPAGARAADLTLPVRIGAALAGTGEERMVAVAGERVLVVHRREVRRDGRDLGTVLTLHDRTDLDTLTRELDTVRSLSGALRAQRHEFANRLHTLAGLLQTGHRAEAVEYLHTLSGAAPAAMGPVPAAVRDPYLQAFLAAKTAEAAESDVRLDVADTSWVPGRVAAPVTVTTVLGNLVDNAVRAARLGNRQPASVEVTLLADGTALHVSVADSGDGVPEAARDRIFVDGYTTRLTAGHGLGLALTRQAARSQGGGADLADPGDGDHGAVFVAQLPGVLAADPAGGAGSAAGAPAGADGEAP